jgi:hypothetical protein
MSAAADMMPRGNHSENRKSATVKDETLIPKLIRMLGSSSDNEVLTAARALAPHLEDLAQAWEKAQTERPTPKPVKPFDYSKVETAVTLYAQDKTQLTMNKLIRAIQEMVAELREPYDKDTVNRYIAARLRTLGFKPSSSGLSYSRNPNAAKNKAEPASTGTS